MWQSKIFEWFGEDFVAAYVPREGFSDSPDPVRASLNFAGRYLPSDDASWLRQGRYEVRYLKYDWSLNERISGADRR